MKALRSISVLLITIALANISNSTNIAYILGGISVVLVVYINSSKEE